MAEATKPQTTTAPANVPATRPANELAMLKRDTADVVAERVRKFQESGEINLPEDYSVENAMKSAWLILQGVEDRSNRPALQVCTKDSIANSLLDMVVQGLNPAKKQCYFIVYGNKLVCQRSYFGTMAVAKIVDPSIDEVIAEVVYEADDFKYKINRGRKEITIHEQALENVDGKKIKAAYCIIFGQDGEIIKTEIMTAAEIKQAWAQSQMKPVDEKGIVKPGSTHDKFSADMAKKTVINRACKPIINSSNDRTLLRDCIRRSEAVIVDEEVSAEIAEHANTGEVLKIQEPVIDGEFSPDELASEPGTTQGKSAPPETPGKGPNW